MTGHLESGKGAALEVPGARPETASGVLLLPGALSAPTDVELVPLAQAPLPDGNSLGPGFLVLDFFAPEPLVTPKPATGAAGGILGQGSEPTAPFPLVPMAEYGWATGYGKATLTTSGGYDAFGTAGGVALAKQEKVAPAGEEVGITAGIKDGSVRVVLRGVGVLNGTLSAGAKP